MAFNIDEVMNDPRVKVPAGITQPRQSNKGFDIDAVINTANQLRDRQSQSQLEQMKQNVVGGILQKPGFEPGPGLLNKAAYYGGEYGPTGIGATLGSMVPGLGPIVGPAVGAATGRIAQNIVQDIANVRSPGSAAQKSPIQQGIEPASDALAQGLVNKAMLVLKSATTNPIADYLSAQTGVKPNLMRRTFDHIEKVFSSPSVEKAGSEISGVAEKAGIKTGTEGYKLATASMLGKDAATDEFSTATTLKMAELARNVPGALTPQEMYSTAEGLRKAMSAPKYLDPHGPFAQNFRMYTQQLVGLEDQLEQIITGYGAKRAGYADALAKEALSSVNPLNKNMSASQLKLVAQGAMVAGSLGSYESGHKESAAAMLLGAAMLSPLMVGAGLRAATMAASTKIPQTFGRMGIAGTTQEGINYLQNALERHQ